MKNEKLLETFFRERNSSPNTERLYRIYIKDYEQCTNKTISQLLNIAEEEENNNIRWKNTRTREYLMAYREHLYNNYCIGTAQNRMGVIMTFYRHFDIEIPKLPYFSQKQVKRYAPIRYEDLPDRDILKEALNISNNRARAILLFMSSTGISKIDTHNITIKDYLDAVYEFTNTYDLSTALENMKGQDIIPTFHLRRQKTGQDYITFCSHEAVNAINIYLENRTDDLTLDSPLFKIHERDLGRVFEKVNDYLELGSLGAFNRFRSHMMRKYHASQLAEAGMSTEKINLLQGRKVKGVAHESYIRIKTDTLKQEYIQALPYIVVEDVNKVKTELQSTKEELKTVTSENKVMKNNLTDILKRIEMLEKK